MSETCPMCGSVEVLHEDTHIDFECNSTVYNVGRKILQSVVCKDRQIAALTQCAEQAERERDEAVPFMLAVKDAHNGYDEESRNTLNDLKEPATPEQALRELNEEWEEMLTDATDRLTAAEFDLWQLQDDCIKSNDEVCQIAGKALGFMWFKEDQETFPGATEENGVFVGEHCVETIVAELAKKYGDVVASEKRLREGIERIKQVTVDTDHDAISTSWLYDKMAALLAQPSDGKEAEGGK